MLTGILFSPAAVDAHVVSAIAPGDVLSIRIVSTWTGDGQAMSYRDVIRPFGDTFRRQDGSIVDRRVVSAVLDALASPRHDAVTASDVGLGANALQAHLGEGEQCLNDRSKLPNVRRAFDRRFVDEKMAQEWLENDFRSEHTDDDPRFTVDIVTTSGDISISSASQHLLMLPLTIRMNGINRHDSNSAIPRALAQLLPEHAENRDRLAGFALFHSWAIAVCQSQTVEAEGNLIGRAAVEDLAARHHLRVVSFENYTGEYHRWSAKLAEPTDPRITADLQSTDASAERDLSETRARMDRILGIPWLKHQLDLTPDAFVRITDMHGIFLFDPPRFRAMNRPHAATLLEAQADDAAVLWLGESSNDQAWSDFYLFPDGTMILEEFQLRMPPFPFAPGGYAQLPLVGPLTAPSTPQESHVAGLIIRPDGMIETNAP